MTVSALSNKVSFAGNGATTSFPFTFPGVAATDLAVFITDSDGVITELSSSLYSVTLTAAVAPNPTGTGGSITYPLTGSPLASGNTLTILRTIPLTQPTSLANQGTSYQTVIEQALDNVLMQIQQLNERLGRQITVPVSDDDPEELPTAEERASLFFAFDSDGNPIATEGPVSGAVVSSAMQPVIEAASLALGRAAFGLGDIAVEDIGAGLEDDGAGNVRTINIPANDSTNQSVVAAFHTDERHATVAITYTNPAASTLFDGFGYYVYALGGDVTFAIDAGDAFYGMGNGVSLIIPKGTATVISTDGVLTWYARPIQLWGPSEALNLSITASVASNNLTIAIKDRNGNDPSASSPTIIPFRSATASLGLPAYRALTSALSIVAASGASLGTSSGSVPFALWLVAFDDGSTLRFGLINCLSGQNIYPLGRSPLVSSTQISAAATAAQTFYTNGAAVTAKAYTIIARLEWGTGLVTAGTWASGPTKIDMYGPNLPLPGQPTGSVKAVFVTDATISSTSTTYVDITGLTTGAMDLVSIANLVKISWKMAWGHGTSAGRIFAQMLRNSTAVGGGATAGSRNNVVFSASSQDGSILNENAGVLLDAPASLTPTYKAQWLTNAGTLYMNRSGNDTDNAAHARGSSSIIAEEIQT